MPSTSHTALYLALDQGGHGSRAIVFDALGQKLAEAHRPIETRVEGARVEIDAEALVESLRDSAEAVCRQLGDESRRIRVAGLATQRSNIACWHRRTGEPLAPVLSWQDRRAGDYLEGLDAREAHRLTGLFPNPHYGASKLAWCLDHLQPVAAVRERGELMLGPMASFLAARLTGAEALADPANASRTLLWNIDRRDWDETLCRHFGIEPSWLPRCVDSRHDFGMLKVAGQAIPLTVVTGDLSAAAFVHGVPEPALAYATVGTGAFVQRLTQARSDGAERLLNGMVWSDAGEQWYSLEGTVNGAGSALSWLAREHGLEDDKLHEHLSQWCDEVEPSVLFLNGVSGLGSPHWRADFPTRFVGEGELAQQAVAVVESIVFLLQDNLEAMAAELEAPRAIVVGGGLARVDGFCRRLAELSGVRVVRSGEHEATAKGLAYLLAGMPAEWRREPGEEFSPQGAVTIHNRYRAWRAEMAKALADAPSR